MTRLILRAIDFGGSAVFAALCIKARLRPALRLQMAALIEINRRRSFAFKVAVNQLGYH
jgi:hypothetical protein